MKNTKTNDKSITDEQGVKMIVDLQKFAGIKEPKSVARKGWAAMDAADRNMTKVSHALCLPEKHSKMFPSKSE